MKEAVAAVGAYESTYQPEVHSSFADTQEVPYASEIAVAEPEPEPEPMFAEPAPVAPAPATAISTDQLPPK